MIGVLIVNKSSLMCSVTATALKYEPDIRVVGLATDVDEALDLIWTCNCDLVLANVNLPNKGALQLIRGAKALSSVKVLVVGLTKAEEEVILRYIEAGAAGYVLGNDSVEDLLKNIRAVYNGEALVSPEVAAAMILRIAELAQPYSTIEPGTDEVSELTPREREVLDLIGAGLSNQEIAVRLVIEVGTVKNHVHNILRKLDVSSRQDAAVYWGAIRGI
ncbi:MAG: response regulator transcription factor [Anaerolineae bacterium]|jgi:DNA-binding NarL/FixJ family response regulator